MRTPNKEFWKFELGKVEVELDKLQNEIEGFKEKQQELKTIENCIKLIEQQKNTLIHKAEEIRAVIEAIK